MTPEGATLLITDGDVEHGGAVLRLCDEAPGPPAQERESLAQALQQRGVARWGRPINLQLLLQTIQGDAGRTTRGRPSSSPDLSDAPHPWLELDASTMELLNANAHALDVLGLEAGTSFPLDAAGADLPPSLLANVHARRVGAAELEWGLSYRQAVWWTTRRGSCVLCLVRGGPTASHSRSLAEIGQLTATFAHEIRNPLAAIAGALDLLAQEEDADARADILGQARDRLRLMRMLLDDTLRLARPTERGPPEPIQVRDLVTSSVARLHADPACTGVRVRQEALDDGWVVSGHAEPLARALHNLLLNAAQAQGLVGEIRVHGNATERLVILRVEDQGPGIDPEWTERIFRPFYTTRPEGTGLGLAQARQAVEASGGTLAVESVASGACLRLELPRALG